MNVDLNFTDYMLLVGLSLILEVIESTELSKKIEETYLTEIISNFINDLPKRVIELHQAVPMEICMASLLVTSFTGSNVEQALEVLTKQLEDEENRISINVKEELPEDDLVKDQKLPSPHYVRKNLKA